MKEAILLPFFFIQGKFALLFCYCTTRSSPGGWYIFHCRQCNVPCRHFFCLILHKFYFRQILRNLSNEIGSLTKSFKFYFSSLKLLQPQRSSVCGAGFLDFGAEKFL